MPNADTLIDTVEMFFAADAEREKDERFPKHPIELHLHYENELSQIYSA